MPLFSAVKCRRKKVVHAPKANVDVRQGLHQDFLQEVESPVVLGEPAPVVMDDAKRAKVLHALFSRAEVGLHLGECSPILEGSRDRVLREMHQADGKPAAVPRL